MRANVKLKLTAGISPAVPLAPAAPAPLVARDHPSPNDDQSDGGNGRD